MSEKPKKKRQLTFWQRTVPLWLFMGTTLILLILNFIPIAGRTVVEYFTITATPQYYGAERTDYTFIESLSTATEPVIRMTDEDRIINAIGTAEANLNTITPMCINIERSANGQFVFRIFLQGETGMELFRIDEDGENLCRLTNNSGTDDYPTWSPDGEKIAYVSIDSDYGLYLMDADGSNIELLHTGGTAYSHPAWSPDGQHIVFQAIFEEIFDIYRLELATGEIVNLTNQERLDNMPAYSPDGEFIVFTSDRTFNPYINTNPLSQSHNYEIYMMNSDGTNPRRLTVNSHADSNPTFSPDSTQIVYGSWEIRIMNRDGSEDHHLTNGYSALWLPDGRIAFSKGGIYTILPDGSNETLIIDTVPLFGSGIEQLDYTPSR